MSGMTRMGLFDRFRKSPAQTVQLARRSYMFSDMDSARKFTASVQSSRGFGSNDMMSFLQLTPHADQFGGQLVRSSTARETRVYGYLHQIYDMDREYLVQRDPTAGMLVEDPARYMWNGMPMTYIAEVDAFFAEQDALGLTKALVASYQEYYQNGGSFVYLETTGDPATRLRRGERPLRWCYVPAANVIDSDEGDHGYLLSTTRTDPLLDHGIEYISFYLTEEDRARNTPTTVHGSRLIPVNLSARSKWWRTDRIPLNRVHDTLWELRDVVFSHVRTHFQGDPIVVDVDLSADAQKALNFQEMDDTQKTRMGQEVEQSIVDYNAGAKTSFAPVMGFKMRRLGAGQLPDPKEIISTLVSRLANGGPFPPKMIVASTKGNTDVSDQDLLTLAGNIQTIRNSDGYAHLRKALLMGRTMGANGLRMQDSHELPPPQELDWQPVRPLSPRDIAFTEKTDASIARQLQEMSLELTPRLKRKFPEDTRFRIPLWLAARGRLPDGTSADPLPPVAPVGGSSASAEMQDLREDVQAVADLINEQAEDPPKPVHVHIEGDST